MRIQDKFSIGTVIYFMAQKKSKFIILCDHPFKDNAYLILGAKLHLSFAKEPNWWENHIREQK